MTDDHLVATADTDVTEITRRISFVLFLMTTAFVLVRTGRDALYFQDQSLTNLPWTYLAIAMMAGPMAMMVLGSMRAFGPARVRIVLPLLTAGALVAYRSLAQPGSGLVSSAAFAVIPLVWGVMFATAWLLAGELLEKHPRAVLAHAYARMGASSILGGVVGGLWARLIASLCAPEDLFVFGSTCLVGSALALLRIHRSLGVGAAREAPKPARSRPGILATMRPNIPILRNAYLRSMMGAAILGGLVGVLVEYQFYFSAALADATDVEQVQFFATIYTTLSALAFALQMWVTPRLQRSTGVAGSLLLLPVGLFLGSVMLLLGGAAPVMRSVLRLTEGGLKSSVYRSNWEQAYLGIAKSRRLAAKVVVDGMGSRAGEAMAALMLVGLLHYSATDADSMHTPITWVSWLLILGTVVWAAMTRGLRRSEAEFPPDHGPPPAPVAPDT